MKAAAFTLSACELDAARDRRFAEDLAKAVARKHGRVWLAVFAENRDPATLAARREVADMLRSLNWSLPRIGRALGKHHTAIMHLLAGGRRRVPRPA